MSPPLDPREVLLLVHEPLIVLFLESLVPLEEVVRAVVVLGVVGPLAAAADGVEHLELPQLVVLEVVEQYFWAEVTVAVPEVLDVDYVLVLDAPGVLRVPPAQDQRRRQRLVAQLAHVDLAVGAPNVGEQEFFDVVLAQRLRSLTGVVTPRVLLLQTLQNVEDRGVLLTVMPVEWRSFVVRQGMVDVAVTLGDVGLASIFPALDEELLHVLVGETGAGRDDTVCHGPPLQIVHRRKLARVQ